MHKLKPLFKLLDTIPGTQQYNLLLITYFKSSIKNNTTILNKISGSAITSRTHCTRYGDCWDVPFIRTNIRRQMLKYKLSSVPNELANKDADILPLSKTFLTESTCFFEIL